LYGKFLKIHDEKVKALIQRFDEQVQHRILRAPAHPAAQEQAPPPVAPVVLVAPPPAVARNPAPPRPRLGGSRSCCWPIGEPGTSEFRFCEGEPMSGKPYCTEHAAIAYVKPREKERREDAA
jgi:GcrA cell cycle regulator